MNEQVVLVDENDKKIGLMDKLEAHRGEGKLHRAISVLLWRMGKAGKEVLLQKRAATKPLWPLFWAETCSTHPRDGEGYEACTVRRLQEEMGIMVREEEIKLVFKLLYHAKYNEEFSERELDAILVGKWDGNANPNLDEVVEWKWISWSDVIMDIKTNPDQYTTWFILLANDPRVRMILGEK